jgi:tetratricopeptide (TPR) repeat protein
VQLARDVLRERIDVLDSGARDVLSTASVLGERFDANLLQTVCGIEMDALLAALDAGTRAGLIVIDGSHQYRFCHALMRNVLYDELPSGARMAVHHAAAKAIEPTARIVARHGELAHHYHRSLPLGDARTAAAAARRAAEEAVRAGEFGDAAMFCQWALESQPLDVHASARERAELLLLRARSARHAGHGQDARAAVAQLIDLAREYGYADLLVRAARVLRPGRTWGVFADPMVRGALEETLRIRPAEDDEQRISALSQLASVAPYALDMQRSKALSATALELARKLGKPTVLAETLRARLYSLSGPDDIDALLSAAREMLALDGDGASWISISAHSACYGAAVHRGDLAAADQALSALGRTARMQQRPEALWFHDRLRAQQRFLQGESPGTESGFAQLQGMRLNPGSWLFRIPQALLALEREGAAAAAAHWDLSSLVSRTDELHAEYRVGLARVAVEAGRADLARSVLEHLASDDFASITKDIGYLNTLANLSLVAIALEDRPRARALYELLAPYPNHNSPSRLMYYQGSVSHFLGLLAEFLGDGERAAAHFDSALTMNERLGHGSQLARTYYEYARFLLGYGHGSRGRGQQLKTQGAHLAASLGMNALEARARAL